MRMQAHMHANMQALRAMNPSAYPQAPGYPQIPSNTLPHLQHSLPHRMSPQGMQPGLNIQANLPPPQSVLRSQPNSHPVPTYPNGMPIHQPMGPHNMPQPVPQPMLPHAAAYGPRPMHPPNLPAAAVPVATASKRKVLSDPKFRSSMLTASPASHERRRRHLQPSQRPSSPQLHRTRSERSLPSASPPSTGLVERECAHQPEP